MEVFFFFFQIYELGKLKTYVMSKKCGWNGRLVIKNQSWKWAGSTYYHKEREKLHSYFDFCSEGLEIITAYYTFPEAAFKIWGNCYLGYYSATGCLLSMHKAWGLISSPAIIILQYVNKFNDFIFLASS